MPEDKLQLIFNGRAVLHSEPSTRRIGNGLKRWQDYGTIPAPSTVWMTQEEIPLSKDLVAENFGMVEFIVVSVEILQLGEPHSRVLWTDKGVEWVKRTIVP